jgi:hypothetical protein
MATLGDDIGEVFEEVGVHFSVIRGGEAFDSGEYLVYDLNRQVTKPFIREHFLEAEMSYIASLRTGDIAVFDDGRKFLVMNRTAEQFENEAVLQNAVLYMSNASVRILRSEGEDWDENYLKIPRWSPIHSGEVDALITEALYGHSLESDKELAMIGIENHELYIPKWVGIEVRDRVEWSSGEFYQINTVMKRRYSGIDVAELGVDTRL